jgi:hypothetical protein
MVQSGKRKIVVQCSRRGQLPCEEYCPFGTIFWAKFSLCNFLGGAAVSANSPCVLGGGGCPVTKYCNYCPWEGTLSCDEFSLCSFLGGAVVLQILHVVQCAGWRWWTCNELP